MVKINSINSELPLINFSTIASFEKGIEIGASNYIETYSNQLIAYLRVGDLNYKSSTYIDSKSSKNFATESDILLALDGAPGRINVGLKGAFSSGLYKVIVDNTYRGLAFFELNSNINQKIISNHSQGTTILHASKAIPFLLTIYLDKKTTTHFNNLFKRIIDLKTQLHYLQNIKQLFLKKYFTNQ